MIEHESGGLVVEVGAGRQLSSSEKLMAFSSGIPMHLQRHQECEIGRAHKSDLGSLCIDRSLYIYSEVLSEGNKLRELRGRYQ